MKAIFRILIALALGGTFNGQHAFAQLNDTIYHIRKLEITGNRKTKDYIITRELDLQVSDTISSRTLRSRLERNRQRVYNTRLFVFAKITPSFQADQVDILIEVKENWYIGGGVNFKLIDRNFNEWWRERNRDLSRVVYGVALSHNNFRGRREKLKVVAETGFSDRFHLSYDIPYIDKKRQTGFQIYAKYRGYKNVAYNTDNNKLVFTGQMEQDVKTQFEGMVQLRRRQGFYITHRLELSYTYDRISDTLIQLNPFYHRNGNLEQRYFQVGYLFSYDTRDNVNYPVKGQVVEGSIRQRGVLPTDNFRSLEFKLGGGYYKPLTSRWSTGLVGKMLVTLPRKLPFNQIRGLGYSDEFIRGFDLYLAHGTVFGLGKSNLRYKFFDKVIPLRFIPIKQFNMLPLACYFNIFADAGYSSHRFAGLEKNNTLSNQWLSSAGIGLDIIALLNATVRLNLSRNSIGETNLFVNLQKDF